jgi:hypothetical protein
MVSDEVTYQVVAARRAQQDGLMWQVPVLSLTAQAFLFTISLGAGSSTTARVVAGLLSVVTTVLSMLLMGKHRLNEIHDAQWLEEYERAHGLPPVHSREYVQQWHERNSPAWGRISLFEVWLRGLALFGLAAVVVVVLAVFAPGTLD